MGNSPLHLMTNTIWQWYRYWTSRPAMRIVMFGSSGAGKTTILYRLKQLMTSEKETNSSDIPQKDYLSCIIPTIGFNLEQIDHPTKRTITIEDIGGGCMMYRLWHVHFQHSAEQRKDPNYPHQLIIFVVDSTDNDERIQESRDTFNTLLGSQELSEHPPDSVLVLANKQDHPEARSIEQVGQVLGFGDRSKLWLDTRRIRSQILGCSAATGQGLRGALEWLIADHD